MKYSIKVVLLCLFLSIIISTFSSAQPFGQIFTRQDADTQFGPVITSVAFAKQNIQNFLTQTNNYIMFRIENNSAIVLDNHRMPLYPTGVKMNSSDKFIMYSTSVLEELLSLGNDETVYVEQRSNVLCITNGGFTMEYGVFCPPICD
jgi:hypothetical protein